MRGHHESPPDPAQPPGRPPAVPPRSVTPVVSMMRRLRTRAQWAPDAHCHPCLPLDHPHLPRPQGKRPAACSRPPLGDVGSYRRADRLNREREAAPIFSHTQQVALCDHQCRNPLVVVNLNLVGAHLWVRRVGRRVKRIELTPEILFEAVDSSGVHIVTALGPYRFWKSRGNKTVNVEGMFPCRKEWQLERMREGDEWACTCRGMSLGVSDTVFVG